MMRTFHALSFLIAMNFISPVAALDRYWEINPEWYMLTCAGFGYHLELDNYAGEFRLVYGDECVSVIRPVYKGKFQIENNSLILNFGDIKAHYYLKQPYTPPCDNLDDSLTKSEQELICDKSQFADAMPFLSPEQGKKRVFLKNAALFPLRFEVDQKDEKVEMLLKDLKTHCFIEYKDEE